MRERVPIGGPRRSVRICDGSDPIPAEDLRAFQDVSMRRGTREREKRGLRGCNVGVHFSRSC